MQLETSTNEKGGRGSRIRKAKVVFDPSDGLAVKRRATISSSESDTKTKSQSLKTMDVKRETNGKRLVEWPTKTIDFSRRNTITNIEKGCIVCARSDIKKGRFVYCLHCSTRGHFTCLRNNKMISTSNEEATWQCVSCQTCNVCYEATEERLYKCVSCANMYHLQCQKKKTTYVKKKSFKCENCNELESLQAKAQPNNGFAGFSEKDTTQSNPNSSSLSVSIGKEDFRNVSSPVDDPLDISNTIHILSDTPSPISEPILGNRHKNSSTFDDDIDESTAIFNQNNCDMNDDLNEVEWKHNDKDIIKIHNNIPDVRNWDCDEIFTYFMGTTTAEYAHLFKENEIDGGALLLITREDVLTKFDLKLGPALRLYSHILTLQFRNNNPILGWDED